MIHCKQRISVTVCRR